MVGCHAAVHCLCAYGGIRIGDPGAHAGCAETLALQPSSCGDRQALLQSESLVMSITREEILKISHLARLHVNAEEAEQYAVDLPRILAWVQQMNAVDTRGIEPMAHPLDASQRLREDTVTEADRREEFQAIAPRTEKGLYLVPKVIE